MLQLLIVQENHSNCTWLASLGMNFAIVCTCWPEVSNTIDRAMAVAQHMIDSASEAESVVYGHTPPVYSIPLNM